MLRIQTRNAACSLGVRQRKREKKFRLLVFLSCGGKIIQLLTSCARPARQISH